LIKDIDHPQDIFADVCIVGAGAAGITIAREFIGTNVKVCLLEAGGLEYQADSQKLYEASTSGFERRPTTATRLRYFGGTTNLWSGACAPFLDSDMDDRPWIKYSDWPIRQSDISKYYLKTAKILDLNDDDFSLRASWRKGIPSFNADKTQLETRVFKMSPPTRFGNKFQSQLSEEKNIQVLLNSPAINFLLSEDTGSISQVVFKPKNGKIAKVTAKTVVLACGGIENPRLLLLSKSQKKRGLGNSYDQVGRYLADHIRCWPASLHTRNPEKIMLPLEMAWTGPRGASTKVNHAFGLTKKEKQNLKVAGSWVYLKLTEHQDSGYRALQHLSKSDQNVFSDLSKIATGFDEVTINLWRKFFTDRESWINPSSLELQFEFEQTPHPDNRIILINELDSLGLPKAHLNWSLREADIHTIKTTVNAVGHKLSVEGMGRIKLADWFMDSPEKWSGNVLDTSHPSGTTKMSLSPATGVTDGDCQVWGVDGLYCAGSSLFPTAGSSNPTFTIVAMALRLADHIKKRHMMHS